MKNERMGRGLLLLALLFLLSGCSAPQETVPTPTPPVVEAPQIEAEGTLADTARRRMEPYQDQLNRVSLQCEGNLTYTIPGDLIAKMARDAEEMGAEPVDGRYQFTWRQSSQHTYTATGLEVQEEIDASPTEHPDSVTADTPMDDQKMGDFVASGGGLFARSYAYDAAADLSAGTAEITDTLNGEITGHELFSFAMRGDALYFVDAALELTAALDELENQGIYLVAVGILEKNRVEIVEYQVTSSADIPEAASLEWDRLLASVVPLTRLTAQGDQVQVWP